MPNKLLHEVLIVSIIATSS